MTSEQQTELIAARLDALTKAVEALASQLSFWEQWQREQSQWPRAVTVMGERR